MQLTPQEFELLLACVRHAIIDFTDRAQSERKTGKNIDAGYKEAFVHCCNELRLKMEQENRRTGLLLPIGRG